MAPLKFIFLNLKRGQNSCVISAATFICMGTSMGHMEMNLSGVMGLAN